MNELEHNRGLWRKTRPHSERERWPCRWPVTPTGPSASQLDDCERQLYRGRISAASSSPSTIAWMNSRTRSRNPASMGSNQSSNK